jgi:catechol 2,3-dioxygenase-like lactoylglutathione lyase family enzyme
MSIFLQTPTPNLEASLDFYRRLNFQEVDGQPNVFTDGKVYIEVNPDRYARSGIKIFREDWSQVVNALSSLTNVMKINEGYLLSDPSGVWIYLLEKPAPFELIVKETSESVLGNYAGICLELIDIAKAALIYEAIGFKLTAGSAESGFASYSLDDFVVTLMKPLMCPHLFFNPSMTYFNGKINNPIIIAKIRELKIPITEEISHFNKEGIVDNIIIRDPGGFGFFIYND